MVSFNAAISACEKCGQWRHAMLLLQDMEPRFGLLQLLTLCCSRSVLLNWVVVSDIFYFHPYLGKIPILTNIFQTG